MKLKHHILTSLAALQIASLSYAAQQPLTPVTKKATGDAITQIRNGFNAELAKQQTMNTELYSLTASGLPPCDNAGDIREWDGDSWECTPIIDYSATSPLSFNSATGVLSLIPWASQSALETWLGWSFSGGTGSGYVAMTAAPYSDVPCTSGQYGDYGSTGYLCTGGFWAKKWDLTAHVNPTP